MAEFKMLRFVFQSERNGQNNKYCTRIGGTAEVEQFGDEGREVRLEWKVLRRHSDIYWTEM